jgi:hypothetical protein
MPILYTVLMSVVGVGRSAGHAPGRAAPGPPIGEGLGALERAIQSLNK